MTKEDALQVLRDELLTVKEYADVTRRHPEHIRQLCRIGKIRGALRVGGQWRIRFVIDLPPCNS
jgi:excisionase family DNA binding protein